jgi:hypothetical protein
VTTFPEMEIDNKTIYILNGIFIEHETIDSIFNQYLQSDVVLIDKIDKSVIDSSTFFLPDTKVILLQTKGVYKRKILRKRFKEAKKLFSIYEPDSVKNKPVLIINEMQIDKDDCHSRMNKIKFSKVFGVQIIDRPVSIDKYGTAGQNGLVIIKIK